MAYKYNKSKLGKWGYGDEMFRYSDVLSYNGLKEYNFCPDKYYFKIKQEHITTGKTRDVNSFKGAIFHKILAGEKSNKFYELNLFNQELLKHYTKVTVLNGVFDRRVKRDNFIGIIDYMDFDKIIDFKFGNASIDERQLMYYRWLSKSKRDLYVLHFPDVTPYANETLSEFKNRISKYKPTEIKINYNEEIINDFLRLALRENIKYTHPKKCKNAECKFYELCHNSVS